MALTAAAINLIYNELTAEARTAGSYGQLFKDNVDAKVSLAALASVCTEARLAELAAANLPADVAAVKAETALIVADTNELQTDDVPGLIAALNDISTANVLTQVNAALDTAIAELAQAIPTATPTVRTGLMLLYMALRNKLDLTATLLEVHNNAGTVITKKALTDDGTTYSEALMAAGP